MNITIPMVDFLDMVIGSRDYSVVSAPIAELVKSADPKEVYSHVEAVENELYKIYRIKDWRESFERQRRLKDLADKRRQRLNAHREAVDSFIDCVAKLSGSDREQSAQLARVTLAAPNGRVLAESMITMASKTIDIEALFDSESTKLTLNI